MEQDYREDRRVKQKQTDQAWPQLLQLPADLLSPQSLPQLQAAKQHVLRQWGRKEFIQRPDSGDIPCYCGKLWADSAELTWLAKRRDILVPSLASLVMWRISCSMGVMPAKQRAGQFAPVSQFLAVSELTPSRIVLLPFSLLSSKTQSFDFGVPF